MKILFLGDSITEGAAAGNSDNTFISLVHARTGFECLNFGVSGTCIAPLHKPHEIPSFNEDFITRSKRMPKAADLVFVFGGTNDFGHGDAPLGKESDKEDTTFYGSLYVLFTDLCKTYGKDKIKIILPLPRYDQNSTTGEFFASKPAGSPVLKAYNDAIKNMAKVFEIELLDFSDNFGIITENGRDANPYISNDGLHPNQRGHALLADLLVDYFIDKGFTRYNRTNSIQDLLNDYEYAPYNKYLFYDWDQETFKNYLHDVNKMTFLGVNRFYEMIKQGLVSFHELDSNSHDANIFLMSHKDHRKVAIGVAGGGYACVCSAMESIPIGMFLFDKGFDVAILTYGVKKYAAHSVPVDDLANAIRYLLKREKELNIDMEDYCVYGSSAGGYLVAQFGTENHGYKVHNVPKPAAICLQYPVISMNFTVERQTYDNNFYGYQNVTQADKDEYSTELHVDKDYPATYLVKSVRDGIVDEIHAKLLIEQLEKYHIPYLAQIIPGQGHGFGVGTFSVFDGWAYTFIEFWKSHFKK